MKDLMGADMGSNQSDRDAIQAMAKKFVDFIAHVVNTACFGENGVASALKHIFMTMFPLSDAPDDEASLDESSFQAATDIDDVVAFLECPVYAQLRAVATVEPEMNLAACRLFADFAKFVQSIFKIASEALEMQQPIRLVDFSSTLTAWSFENPKTSMDEMTLLEEIAASWSILSEWFSAFAPYHAQNFLPPPSW